MIYILNNQRDYWLLSKNISLERNEAKNRDSSNVGFYNASVSNFLVFESLEIASIAFIYELRTHSADI